MVINVGPIRNINCSGSTRDILTPGPTGCEPFDSDHPVLPSVEIVTLKLASQSFVYVSLVLIIGEDLKGDTWHRAETRVTCGCLRIVSVPRSMQMKQCDER